MEKTETYTLMQEIISYFKKYNDYKQHFTNSSQARFMQDVERLLPGHQQTLMERYPDLENKDLLNCYLYLLGFSDTDIAILKERDRSTIYRQKKDILNRKIHNPNGQIYDLVKIR